MMIEKVFRAKDQKDIPFAELKSDECHWPAWDARYKTGPACGAQTSGISPYCAYHDKVSQGLITDPGETDGEGTTKQPASGAGFIRRNHSRKR